MTTRTSECVFFSFSRLVTTTKHVILFSAEQNKIETTIFFYFRVLTIFNLFISIVYLPKIENHCRQYVGIYLHRNNFNNQSNSFVWLISFIVPHVYVSIANFDEELRIGEGKRKIASRNFKLIQYWIWV